VVLTEGQIVTGLEIQMWPGAVVTGVVTDESGEPVSGVDVQLQKPSGTGGGNPIALALASLGGAPRSTTDDRGVYRIYGAAPGDYLVAATVSGTFARARRLSANEVADAVRSTRDAAPAAGRATGAAPAPPVQNVPGEFPGGLSYAPVYFPGTADVARAATVTLGMGEERSSVNIRLEVVPLARVAGTVFAADGTPSSNVQVSLQRLDDSSLIAMLRGGGRGQTAANGQFNLRNVAPGQYRLMARSGGGGFGMPQTGPMFWASTDITMGGQDVTGLVLQLQPGLSIGGRIAFDATRSAPPADASSVMAAVVPMSNMRDPVAMIAGVVAAAAGGRSVNADGTFEVGGLMPGPHLIAAGLGGGDPAASLTWRLGSVIVDGRDLTDLPFDLKPGALPKDVVVTLTDVQQGLSGVISDSSGRPLTQSTVMMFSTDRRYWYSQSRRVLASRPSTDGSYEFSGLLGPTAGEYYLSVVSDLDPAQQYDPAFLDALVKAGPLQITLNRGESKRQDLKVR
jgi:hypothetical protein